MRGLIFLCNIFVIIFTNIEQWCRQNIGVNLVVLALGADRNLLPREKFEYVFHRLSKNITLLYNEFFVVDGTEMYE